MQILSYIYRLAAIAISITPIVLNVIFVNSIQMSLLYVPLLSLVLALFFIYLDSKVLLLLKTWSRYCQQYRTKPSMFVRYRESFARHHPAQKRSFGGCFCRA